MYLTSRSYDTSNTLRNSNRIIFGAIATSGAADGYIAFSPYVSNVETERMRITSTGNVGIGTTTPNQQLEITGNFRLPQTTFANSNSGVIYKDGARFLHDFNYGNNGTVTTAGRNTFMGNIVTGKQIGRAHV